MNDSNVVTLPGIANAAVDTGPDEEIIAKLEELLEEAKVGNIKGFAFCATSNHGLIRFKWYGKESRDRMGYVITRLQFDFFNACGADDG